jgi:hypothetical protein
VDAFIADRVLPLKTFKVNLYPKFQRKTRIKNNERMNDRSPVISPIQKKLSMNSSSSDEQICKLHLLQGSSSDRSAHSGTPSQHDEHPVVPLYRVHSDCPAGHPEKSTDNLNQMVSIRKRFNRNYLSLLHSIL